MRPSVKSSSITGEDNVTAVSRLCCALVSLKAGTMQVFPKEIRLPRASNRDLVDTSARIAPSQALM